MAQGALDGLRLIEMGSLIAGPFCGQLMADHGAEVIKIEAPGAGDPMRGWGRGKPVWFPLIARNKKTITLNLRDPRGLGGSARVRVRAHHATTAATCAVLAGSTTASALPT